MRAVSQHWMEITVRYTKTDEDGNDKRVVEKYVVVAESYAEAEEKIAEALAEYENVDLEIRGMVRPAYGEVFFSDNDKDDKFYTAKVSIITLDEKTEKEKRTRQTYLVQGSSLNGAVKNVDEELGKSMIDYVSISATESKIVDVFEK